MSSNPSPQPNPGQPPVVVPSKKSKASKARSAVAKPLKVPAKIAQRALRGRRASTNIKDEKPIATLRVQVISGRDLLGKDNHGASSDPFVTISLPPTRFTTPVVKKTLSPLFPAKESTFDFPIYASRAAGLELVVYDKDLLRKEYLGEACVKVEDWFGGGLARAWDASLEPLEAPLVSTRNKSTVSGSIQLRIGFVGQPMGVSPANFQTLHQDLVRRSLAPDVMAVPAFEGIGTLLDVDDELDDGLSSSSSESDDEFANSGSYELSSSSSPSPAPVSRPSTPAATVPLLSPIPTSSSSGGRSLAARLTPRILSRNNDKKEYFEESGSPAAGGSIPVTPSAVSVKSATAESGRKKRRRGKSNTKSWSYSTDKDILGIVMIEIKGAEDLPKLKNLLKTGFDMDPFVVTSFGKKIFRTRVVRHSLNPQWDEKLLFHVRRYESNFTIQFSILDWDKMSGNDFIGEATLSISELMKNAPAPNPETGLHDSDGRHDMEEFRLQLETHGSSWGSKHTPTIVIRAKFEPYDALRQKFWKEYIKSYDEDNTGKISLMELQAMLDSLGSTLTQETLEGYYTENNVDPHEGELTVEEVIRCLEHEIAKSWEEKKRVEPEDVSYPPVAAGGEGASTPSLSSLDVVDGRQWPNEVVGLDVTGPSAPGPQDEDPTRAALLGNGEVMNQTNVMVDEAGVPFDVEDDEDDEDNTEEEEEESVERVINIRSCPLCHRGSLRKKGEMDIVTHLAVCASADWSRTNRILVGNFVTSSQAQQKWIRRVVTKVTNGSYQLGANSANILVQDRRTGQLQEEKMAVYVRLGIRILYKGNRERMEGARARRLLKSMSIKQGLKYDSPESAAEIPAFILFHRLDLNEVLDPMESFKTFNEFFYRKLKPEARPIANPDDPSTLVSCADCRLMCFDTIDDATKIWIKGRDFTIQKLLGDKFAGEAGKYTNGGAIGIFRLAPQDYHRYHSPVDGVIGETHKIEGAYYTVNPQAIRTALDVYGENVRTITPIDSPTFGRVYFCAIGAMMVGSIVHTAKAGDTVKRGDEVGYFAFGGSTIILIFEPGKLQWDHDLRLNCRASLETLVQMGTQLGTAKKA